MFLSPKLLIAAAGVAILQTTQGMVEAGYLSTSLPETSVESIVELDVGASESGQALPAPRRGLPQQIDIVRVVLGAAGHSVRAGGMSAPARESAGSINVSGPAAIPAVAAVQLPMTSWVGIEGRKWLPPPFSTGIFRPPRVEHC